MSSTKTMTFKCAAETSVNDELTVEPTTNFSSNKPVLSFMVEESGDQACIWLDVEQASALSAEIVKWVKAKGGVAKTNKIRGCLV